MKHYIIAKFKPEYDWKGALGDIKALFDKTLELEGVSEVLIKESNSDRSNRAHLMIEMHLTKEGLNNFDASEIHIKWKQQYGEMIEAKTIFDCE